MSSSNIGQRVVSAMEGSSRPITVVGIVGDVKTLGLAQDGPLFVYRPLSKVGATIERFG